MVNSSQAVHVKYASLTVSEPLCDVSTIPSIYGTSRWKPGRESKCCDFSKDGERFAWSSGYCTVKVEACTSNRTHDTSNVVDMTRAARTFDCSSSVASVEFAPHIPSIQHRVKSSWLLTTGLESGQIKIWNSVTGEMVFTLSDHQGCVNGLTFAPCDAPLLVSCSSDMTLKVWDLGDDGNMSLTIRGQNFPVLDCAFSPVDEHIVASVGMGKSVILWNLIHKRSFSLRARLRGHNNDVVACSWSPDGALLATASHDTLVLIWDPFTQEKVLALGHQYPLPCPIYAGGANGSWVNSVCFSNDGTKIATVCEDDRLRVWKLWGEECDVILETKLNKSGHQCCFSVDGRTVAVGKQDGSVTLASDTEYGVSSLCHLSRLAVRRKYSSVDLQNLLLPKLLKDYLTYQLSGIEPR